MNFVKNLEWIQISNSSIIDMVTNLLILSNQEQNDILNGIKNFKYTILYDEKNIEIYYFKISVYSSTYITKIQKLFYKWFANINLYILEIEYESNIYYSLNYKLLNNSELNEIIFKDYLSIDINQYNENLYFEFDNPLLESSKKFYLNLIKRLLYIYYKIDPHIFPYSNKIPIIGYKTYFQYLQEDQKLNEILKQQKNTFDIELKRKMKISIDEINNNKNSILNKFEEIYQQTSQKHL